MAQTILIKRSNSTATPASLLEGELAYSTISKNLFIGTNGGASIEILGGQADHTKLLGIEAGAQVNTVGLGVNTFTGKQIFPAVSTSAASILIPNGSTNPTTPVSGDLWANTGVLNWYNGTITKSLAFTTQSFFIGTTAIAINQGTGTLTLPNTALTNSSVTINGNSVALGGSTTVTANTTNSLIIKADTGTTEGTDLYTFNGSSSKTLDIKAGTNITLTKAAGSITINANDVSVAVGELTGLGTGVSTFLATPSSANLISAITDETGTGSLVFSNSPTLVTPNIGIATGTSFNSITGLASVVSPVNGIATVGTSTTVARQDHIHGTDTTRAPVNNPTFTGVVTLAQNPVNPLEAATKQYVDGLSLGLDFKDSVRVATTANITLSGTQTIDTIAVIAGDRVLVKDQTTASQNGIYVVAAGAWSRSTDADTSIEVSTGLFTYIETGSQGGSSYVLSTQGPITLGTTALAFIQFGGGTAYSAGTGLNLVGSVFSLANHSTDYLTSGTLNDARLSTNVMLITTTVDGGTF